MSNYTPITNFAAKDALTPGDPNKAILGTQVSAEFTAIQTAISSKEDSANKGQANGYAPLNASSQLADSYLTSNIPRLDGANNFTSTFQSGGVSLAPTACGAALLDDADAAAGRTTLGLGTAAVRDEGYFALVGHNHSGVYEPADADIAKVNEAETITANWTFTGVTAFDKAYTPAVSDSISAGALTINCVDSNVFYVSMNANVTTLTLSNPSDGQTINVFLTQDATGSRTMTWPASFKWPGGVAGVLSTAANSVDLLVATYRGTSWHATLLKGFAAP